MASPTVTIDPSRTRRTFAALLENAFGQGSRALSRARGVIDSTYTSSLAVEAASAASDLLVAVGLFLESLPHVNDVRSNELIRKQVSALMNDAARLRELSLQPSVGGSHTSDSTGCPRDATSQARAEGGDRDDASLRRRVSLELVETERSYVNSLAAFVTAFADPLQPTYGGFSVSEITDVVLSAVGAPPDPRPGELLSSEEHSLIFGAAKQLLPLNQMMLKQLEELLASWGDASCVGDILFTFAPFFRIYSESFTRQLGAVELLQRLRSERPGFAEFLAAASVACKGQPIESFLIMPVQRIPRYRLLLEQLLKYTPRDHPDFTRCSAALSQVSSVATELDYSLLRFEQSASMLKAVYSFRPPMCQLMLPHRLLLREGALGKRRVSGLVMYVRKCRVHIPHPLVYSFTRDSCRTSDVQSCLRLVIQ
jgi:hypothetical protein